MKSTPLLYLIIITFLLSCSGSKDSATTSTAISAKNDFLQKTDEVLKSKFKVNRKYAQKLINNASTRDYSYIPKLNEKRKCFCQKTYSVMYSDFERKNEIGDRQTNTYNSLGQILKTETFKDEIKIEEIIYERDKFNLLNTITYIKNDKVYAKSKFVYDKDKYSLITYENDVPTDYIIYYLNDKMQCHREFKQDANNRVSERNYKYDKLGRLTEDINEIVYKYKDDSSDYFSEYSVYDSNKEPISRNVRNFSEQELEYKTYDAKGKLLVRSITTYDKSCGTKSIGYNADNNVTYVYITTCKNKF